MGTNQRTDRGLTDNDGIGDPGQSLQGALTYNVLVKSLLGCDQLHSVLGRGRHLHPIILSLVYRDPILCCLKMTSQYTVWLLVQAILLIRSHELVRDTPIDDDTHLHKLVLEVFEAVEADSSHVPILHGDSAFCLFVLTEKWKILKSSNMSIQRSCHCINTIHLADT